MIVVGLPAVFVTCGVEPSMGGCIMGGARNLKLGCNGRTRASAQGAIFFCLWAQCQLAFTCCVHQKDVAESRGRAPSHGVRGAKSQ